MDTPTAVLLGVVAFLAINQLIMRIPVLRKRAFWPGQVLNALVGGTILLFGLPGYEPFPMVSVVVGLLFFLHIAQALKWWSAQSWEDEEPTEYEE